MFKNKFALLMAVLLALLVVMPASAIPPRPATFYGTVMIDGSDAPVDTPVTAWINGTQYAETESFINSGRMVYVLDVPGDDTETAPIEGGDTQDNNTIVFKVNGQEAAQGSWTEGGSSELNLEISAPAPTPTPQPSLTPTAEPTATPQPTATTEPTSTPQPTATSTPIPGSSVFYVKADASGANDGSSWADGYTDLQDALAAAVAGDEIWVAAGTYKPTDDGDRTISFQLKNGVALYGGFDGTESTHEERDWEANATILSGDLNGDDNDNVHPDEATRAENSHNLVRAFDIDQSAILDGFTITGGNANVVGTTLDDSGGMRNQSSSPTLNHLIFTKNSVISFGGAMTNASGSHPTLSHVTFSHNFATNQGGGMANIGESHPTLSHVTFVENAADDGAGMHNSTSNPTLMDVSFINNSAVDNGGGLYNVSNSNPTLKNVIFTGNTAHDGGGICNVASNPTLTNVTFSGNFANFGGGMYEHSNSSTLSNVIFTGNSADYGGAMRNATNGSPTLTNVTITGNFASNDGGGIANLGSSPSLINTIVWNNQDNNGTGASSQIFGGTPTVSYSIVQGGFAGTGNIDSDPLFVSPINPADAPTTAGDFRQQPTSPAVDAGDNSSVPTDTLDLDNDNDINELLPLDLDGQARFVDSPLVDDTGNGSAPIVDMGAYESSGEILPTPTPQPTPTPNPSGTVILALSPVSLTTSVGQSFEVTIEVQAGTQEVAGASAFVNFDPTLMEVTSITAGSSLGTVLQNEFDNSSGHVDFSAGTFSNFPDGTFTLATITFTALAETDSDSDGTPLEFNFTGLRESDVVFNGASVLHSAVGNVVIIYNATLTCAINLQNRPAKPEPLHVSLTVPGESSPAYQFTPTMDSDGTFTIVGLEPNNYELRIKHSRALQNMLNVTLVGGDNSIDCGVLREGDADNNNVVNILDFSILAGTFAKCEGMDSYDERADFNEDNCVNIVDFSLLANNFGQAGAPPWPIDARTAEAAPASTTGHVELMVDAAQQVHVGDTFNVIVRLEAGEQQIDGAQLALNFDAAYLEVESISASESLPLELLNEIDNQRGRINFAAGIELTEDGANSYPSGTIELLQIEFKAKAESDGTSLAFQFGMPSTTDVTFDGTSLLGEHSDATITISNNPTAITTGEMLASPSSAWLGGVLMLTMLLAGGVIVRRRWDRARINRK